MSEVYIEPDTKTDLKPNDCCKAYAHQEIERVCDEMRHATFYELGYSKKHGFEKGHYWLHRKIDQILWFALDRFEHWS